MRQFVAVRRVVFAIASAALVLLRPPCAEAQRPGLDPTLAVAGDVFQDAKVGGWIERRAAARGLGATYREVFSEVAPLLRGASLTVVNLETPISPRYLDDPGPHRPVFNAPPELLDALVDAGVDVVTVANNHAYDQGFEGLRDTLHHARRRGLATVGAGPDGPSACGPVFVDAGGARVGICTWAQGANRRMPPETEDLGPRIAFVHHGTVRSCLAEARRRSDLAVAAFHWSWGDEPWTGPARAERELVRLAAEAGADLVIAHGPHAPGPASRLRTADGRDVMVLFSLGNLLGAMGDPDRELRSSRPGVRDAPIVLVHTRRVSGGRLAVSSLSVTPFWIANPTRGSPWWPPGSQPLVRPLSIRRELLRLGRARCGRPCEERARQYRRRAELTRRAFALDGGPRDWPPPAEEPPPPVEVVRPLPPPEPPREVAEPRPEPPPEPPRAEPTAGPEASGLRARLAAGTVLPLRFRRDTMAIEEADDDAIDRIVALLLEDRLLRVRLTGYAAPGETEMPAATLGRRRALAAMHLIAGAGPSRSRFSTEAGEPGGGGRPGEGHVVIRVVAP